MKILFLIVLALPMFVGGKLFGQDTAVPVAISGFIDAYYSKNFNTPDSRTNKMRNFDIVENQFNLSLAEIVFQKKASPIGFRIDLDYGTTNDAVQPGNGSTLSVLQQGYLTAVLPIGEGLTVDAGTFTTHMGYEVIESKDNWNYSRSLLFAWAVPYYHTGLRLAYPVASNITATIHIVNGWNSNTDNNDFKSVGLALNYSPVSSINIIVNGIDGIEQPDHTIAGKKKVVDLIVIMQVTESLALALNADYGDERTLNGIAVWKGAAVYGRYTVGASSAIALRGEILNDPAGYATGTGIRHFTIKEFTGTFEHIFTGTMLLRGEVRYDIANGSVFDFGGGVNTRSSQTTILIGIISSF